MHNFSTLFYHQHRQIGLEYWEDPTVAELDLVVKGEGQKWRCLPAAADCDSKALSWFEREIDYRNPQECKRRNYGLKP